MDSEMEVIRVFREGSNPSEDILTNAIAEKETEAWDEAWKKGW